MTTGQESASTQICTRGLRSKLRLWMLGADLQPLVSAACFSRLFQPLVSAACFSRLDLHLLSNSANAEQGPCRILPWPCQKSVKRADKPDSVTALARYGNHSSRSGIAAGLEPPTRTLPEPGRHVPI